MKTFCALVSVVVFAVAPAKSRAQEEPVKPAESAVSAAQEVSQPSVEQKIEEQTEMLEVEGTINAKSSHFLALGISPDPESKIAREMAFNVDKDVKIVHKKSYKELHQGDIVKVRYSETKKTNQSGAVLSSNRQLRQVTFLKVAEKTQFSQANNLVTPDEGTDTIPLKGMKGE
jgi:hypothetical protein